MLERRVDVRWVEAMWVGVGVKCGRGCERIVLTFAGRCHGCVSVGEAPSAATGRRVGGVGFDNEL